MTVDEDHHAGAELLGIGMDSRQAEDADLTLTINRADLESTMMGVKTLAASGSIWRSRTGRTASEASGSASLTASTETPTIAPSTGF